jgi:hypothetical protein
MTPGNDRPHAIRAAVRLHIVSGEGPQEISTAGPDNPDNPQYANPCTNATEKSTLMCTEMSTVPALRCPIGNTAPAAQFSRCIMCELLYYFRHFSYY